MKVCVLVLLPNNNVLSAGTTEQQRHVANDSLESEINVRAPAVLQIVPQRLKVAVAEVSELLTFFFFFPKKPITNRVSVAVLHHLKHVCICASKPVRKDCVKHYTSPEGFALISCPLDCVLLKPAILHPFKTVNI